MKERKLNFVKIFEFIFAAVVIFGGIFLRYKVWLTDLSFWVDEDALIRNAMGIITGKYPIWRGLEAEYSPPLFFALTKPIYAIFGLNEVAFRIIPFLASIASLPAFAFLSKKIFKTPFLFLLPLFLVAINENLLFYTQYYKFYSSDFLVTILISIAIFYLSFDKMSYKQAALWGFVLGITSWSAYSAIFFITGILSVLFIKILFKFSKEKILKFSLLSLPFGIMTAFYYYEVIIRRTNMDYLQSAWKEIGNGYFYPHNLEDLRNLIFYHLSISSSDFQLLFLLLILTIGFYFMFIKYKIKTIYLISPCIVILLLAFAEKYPCLERQTLFLFSILLIFLFKAFDFVDMFRIKKFLGIVSVLLLVSSAWLWHTCNYQYLKEVLNNKNYFRMSSAREFYKHLEKEYKQGDWIYSQGRDASLRIYDKKGIIDFFNNIEEVRGFEPFINDVPKGKRIHIYIAEYPYVGDEYVLIYKYIKKNCEIIQNIEEPTGIYVLFKR